MVNRRIVEPTPACRTANKRDDLASPIGAAVTALVLAIAALGGCLKSAAFSCAVETDCTRGGEVGICEPSGFCSFADPACPGGRRYGELSGSLANQCVGAENPDGGPDIDAPAAPFCDAVNEPALVGCWELEGNLLDGSGDNNNGTGTAVAFVAGQTGMAASLEAGARITVADSASLTPTALTIEGWIAPTSLPPAGRMGLLDNDGQYGMFLLPNGISCTSTIVLATTVAIPTGVFTHVACTYDGTTARFYLDGTELGSLGGGTPIGAGNNNGTVIGGNSPSGDPFLGRIDQVRVWSVVRTAQQICTAAGRTTCP
jgi:hypothetical protein